MFSKCGYHSDTCRTFSVSGTPASAGFGIVGLVGPLAFIRCWTKYRDGVDLLVRRTSSGCFIYAIGI